MMWATWWVWLALGLVLAILEVLAPGYIFLGFALGAAITGGILWIGGPLGALATGSLAWTLVVFALASIAAWILLRLLLGVRDGQVKTFESDINDN